MPMCFLKVNLLSKITPRILSHISLEKEKVKEKGKRWKLNMKMEKM